MARLLEEEEAVDFVDGNSWEVTELGPKKWKSSIRITLTSSSSSKIRKKRLHNEESVRGMWYVSSLPSHASHGSYHAKVDEYEKAGRNKVGSSKFLAYFGCWKWARRLLATAHVSWSRRFQVDHSHNEFQSISWWEHAAYPCKNTSDAKVSVCCASSASLAYSPSSVYGQLLKYQYTRHKPRDEWGSQAVTSQV